MFVYIYMYMYVHVFYTCNCHVILIMFNCYHSTILLVSQPWDGRKSKIFFIDQLICICEAICIIIIIIYYWLSCVDMSHYDIMYQYHWIWNMLLLHVAHKYDICTLYSINWSTCISSCTSCMHMYMYMCRCRCSQLRTFNRVLCLEMKIIPCIYCTYYSLCYTVPYMYMWLLCTLVLSNVVLACLLRITCVHVHVHMYMYTVYIVPLC